MEAILAGADFIKFGYVSRMSPKDSTQHAILGVQQFQPLELAKQMTLNVGNAWGVLKIIIECCLKLEPGKYIILKDPNKVGTHAHAHAHAHTHTHSHTHTHTHTTYLVC